MTVKAEKGDLIRITVDVNERIKKGDIYEVLNVNSDETAIYDMSGTIAYVFDNEYVIHRKAGEEQTEVGASDNVNHPSHYTQGGVEVIDIIRDAVKGAEPFEAVCLANVLKYTLRYKDKNGVEDLRKAEWYLGRLIAEVNA